MSRSSASARVPRRVLAISAMALMFVSIVTPVASGLLTPTVSISPSSGTAYPATHFYITVGGLTPSRQYRLQVWDGGGTQRWSQYYTSTSSGAGSSVHQWWWTTGEMPGQYRVRVTDYSGGYRDAYFTVNVNPTISVSPSSGTTSPATHFTLTVGGLTPSSQFRLQIWDGGGTQRWSQYYTSTSTGAGSTTFQWWWTTGETPGTYRARVTDISGKYKETTFTITQPVTVNPTISISPSSGTAYPATHFSITVGGLTPSSQFRFQIWDGGGTQRWSQYYMSSSNGAGSSTYQWWWTSPEIPGQYRVRVTDVSGQYEDGYFTINVNPTIAVSPTSGTTSPATHFNITVGGLTPMSQYRLQVWDGGGTQRWSQLYTATYAGAGESTHQWWWTTGETPGTYRVRVTDVTGKYKETTFAITQPVGNLSVSFTENPYTCDGGSRTFGTISGANPGETITFTSVPALSLASGTANSSGQLSIKWQCNPNEVQTWSVTARGSSSGRTVTFNVVGKAPTVSPTVAVTPASGTEATTFAGTGTGFTPYGSVLLEFWWPSGVKYPQTFLKTASSTGAITFGWKWATGDQFGQYKVRATNQATGAVSPYAYFTITQASTVGPTVSVSPGTGTTSPATVFTIAIGGLTPSGTYRLQIWDGGGVSRWDKNYVATSTGAGSRNHQWYWESPEIPGTYRVRVTDLSSTKFKEATFVITQATANTKPLVIFVQGMNSSASGASASPGDWQAIRSALGTAYDYAMFSYNTSDTMANGYGDAAMTRPIYGAEATCGSIDNFVDLPGGGVLPISNGHSERFREWFQAVAGNRTEVHVVAHSMGGLVVAYALAVEPWRYTPPPALKSVTTLDSPMAGASMVENGMYTLIADFQCSAGADAPRWEDMHPTTSSVVAGVQTMPNAGLFVTVGNVKDVVVWDGCPVLAHLITLGCGADSHLLGKTWMWTHLRDRTMLPDDADCSPEGESFLERVSAAATNHGCVVRSVVALEAIRSNILRGQGGLSSDTCNGLRVTHLGTSANDEIWGRPTTDIISGLGGSDTIKGYDGVDTLCGGKGKDTIHGGSGDDSVFGGDGDDVLWGNDGRDLLNGGGSLLLPGWDTCNASTDDITLKCEKVVAS